MKYKKFVVVGSLFLFVFCFSLVFSTQLSFQEVDISKFSSGHQTQFPSISSGSNQDLIDSIFNSKILEYYDNGYYSQVYEPSIQATYYGLSILYGTGKLNEVNKSEILEYLIAHYDSNSNTFIDTLAFRYLDTDFSKIYFPLSTVLEVNCYAVLSLEMLGELDLINTQQMGDFIWSCYNPVSSGFIGQMYDSGLEEQFKISTADNTFYAVKTLDLLMDDWIGYSTQRDDIIQFINDLQLPGGAGWTAGGFQNDLDANFESLNPFLDPNLFTSYYCLKTLKIFGMEGTIRTADFHQFLEFLYDEDYHYFRISGWDYDINYANIVATSIGLELSDISSFTSINRTAVIDFILDNRNSLGNWDGSTHVTIHELIDTFQVMRSLKDCQEIDQLNVEDRSEIGNSTTYYYQYGGYSLLSEDYTSMNMLYTAISSFCLFDRASDLDIQQLYTRIKNSYKDSPDFSISRFFAGYLLGDTDIYWFRTHPIEFYTSGHKNYISDVSYLNSHESTYYALDSLLKIFKLDDFSLQFNLRFLLNDIVTTQFLNDSYYEHFGAFSHILEYAPNMSEMIGMRIYSDYSYYAIRCLEILSEVLSLDFLDLNFDKIALYNYIDRNIIETPSYLYFDPEYSSEVETVLRNTYYMMYILNSIDMNNKDSDKIRNYVLSNLDYNNIENIYYCYKLSELLDLDIPFNASLTQALVQALYDYAHYNEFYTSIPNANINQEIFLWICEMARNSEIEISATYNEEMYLGGSNDMIVLLQNLILQDFGSYITFKFESSQLGTHIFEKLPDNSYYTAIPIPIHPNNYPQIDGSLCAYEGINLKAEFQVSFSTTYHLTHKLLIDHSNPSLNLEINSSIISDTNYHQLIYGNAYIRVYVDDIFRETRHFTHTDFITYSIFTLNYLPGIEGEYLIEVYLDDGFQIYKIETHSFIQGPIPGEYNPEITATIPLAVTFLAVPGVTIIITSKRLGKLKSNSR